MNLCRFICFMIVNCYFLAIEFAVWRCCAMTPAKQRRSPQFEVSPPPHRNNNCLDDEQFLHQRLYFLNTTYQSLDSSMSMCVNRYPDKGLAVLRTLSSRHSTLSGSNYTSPDCTTPASSFATFSPSSSS